jgi:PAS domain S-box-containing protein
LSTPADTPGGPGAVDAARFRQILEAAPDGFVIVDGDGVIVLVNRQTERLFGYTKEELIGLRVEALIPERLRTVHPAHRAGYAGHPRVRPMGIGLRLFGRRKDGTEFPCEISLSPLETEAGMLTVAAVRDITWRIEAEQRERQLEAERRARAAAEQAVRVRDDFMSIASHELRTPLTTILVRLELLIRRSRAGTLDPALAPELEVPLHSAERLAELIERLLDVTRISTGRLTLDRKRADVSALVRGAAAQLQTAQSAPVRIDAPGPLEAEVDPGRIEQVVTNLVGNALKYGAGKPVDVRVAGGQGRVEIHVRDWGIGIAPELQARIFDRFARGVNETRYAGLGLGLYITREIVEAHGGSIAVASAPGEGAEFTVQLPR